MTASAVWLSGWTLARAPRTVLLLCFCLFVCVRQEMWSLRAHRPWMKDWLIRVVLVGAGWMVNCDCSKSILLILRPLLECSVVIKIEFTTSHFQHDSGLKPEIHMMDNHGGSPEFHTCSGLAALDQTGQSFSHSLVIVVSCGKWCRCQTCQKNRLGLCWALRQTRGPCCVRKSCLPSLTPWNHRNGSSSDWAHFLFGMTGLIRTSHLHVWLV